MRISLRNLKKTTALAFLALAALSGCVEKTTNGSTSKAASDQAPYQNSSPFTILAGSELKDIEPLIKRFGATRGQSVQFKYTGSLDAVDELNQTAYDAVWLSHGKYVQLVPELKSKVKASEKTMYSRVVFGVKPETMKALGWENGKTTWKDILKATKEGRFKFAMTNPTGSNSGFVSLIGLASSLSGKGDALEESDIPKAQLKDFFKGQSLTAGSSGFLANRFKESPELADGMINYESVIKDVAKTVPLQVLIPKEGVVTADYPLMRMTEDSQKTAFYNELIQFIRSEATQSEIVSTTGRTPLSGDESETIVNELPFPGNLKVVDAILSGFLNEFSKPSLSYFVVDTSGSMEREGRMERLKTSMKALASGDGTVGGRFATFKNRESIVLIPFSSNVYNVDEFKLTENEGLNQLEIKRFEKAIALLQPNNGTAIYSGLMQAYGQAHAEMLKGEKTVSIVLLTDGANTEGVRARDFYAQLEILGEPLVPVYAILYGNSDVAEMSKISKTTGGQVFDARSSSLKSVMRTIRSYQ